MQKKLQRIRELKIMRLRKLKSLNKVSVGKTSLCHKSTVLLLGFSRSTQIDHDRASQEKEILMMGSKAKLHGWVIDSEKKDLWFQLLLRIFYFRTAPVSCFRCPGGPIFWDVGGLREGTLGLRKQLAVMIPTTTNSGWFFLLKCNI